MPALEKKWLINETTVEVCCLLEQLKSAKEHIEITYSYELDGDDLTLRMDGGLPRTFARQ